MMRVLLWWASKRQISADSTCAPKVPDFLFGGGGGGGDVTDCAAAAKCVGA